MDYRQDLKDKKKIVIKIGTSTITYPETGNINLDKLEKFVRILINLRNKGKEVIVVSSGAVGIGRKLLGFCRTAKGEGNGQALRGGRAGKAHDDVRKTLRRVQPAYGTGTSDERVYYQ